MPTKLLKSKIQVSKIWWTNGSGYKRPFRKFKTRRIRLATNVLMNRTLMLLLFNIEEKLIGFAKLEIKKVLMKGSEQYGFIIRVCS